VIASVRIRIDLILIILALLALIRRMLSTDLEESSEVPHLCFLVRYASVDMLAGGCEFSAEESTTNIRGM